MNRLTLSTLFLTLAIAVMTLGYANPSYAAAPDCDDPAPTHPSCKPDDGNGGGGNDGATFDVDIKGYRDLGVPPMPVLVLAGGSAELTPWAEGFGGKNGIGLNDASGLKVGTLTGVGSFTVGDADSDCFPGIFLDDLLVHDSDFELHQATIKPGKKGRAEASFWFHGATNDGKVRILYVLKLIGEDGSAAGFPPADKTALTLKMTSWELKVENEGKAIKVKSCQSEGTDPVDIEVTSLVDTS